MVQPIGKEKVKGMLKVVNCASIAEAWGKAEPLDDEIAIGIDALTDQYEGLPRLRELDGYLLLDAGDGETLHVFRDARGTRRELLGQILSSLPKDAQEGDQDTEDERDLADSDMGAREDADDFQPDEEPDYEDHERLGKPRAGKGR